jgi:branched-subunit amino acid transport protein AzlD
MVKFIQMDELTSLDIFFLCLSLSIVISALKVDFARLTPYQILDNLYLSFMYNFLISLPASLLAMFLSGYYKKNK